VPEEIEGVESATAARSESRRSSKIRVVIADDHPIVRTGLVQVLSSQPDFEIVGQAEDGNQALERVRELDPDVLVLDLKMPELDGIAALQTMQQSGLRTRVLILTGSEDRNQYIQAMKFGCAGIVLKRTATDLIVKSIRKVHQGEIWLDSHTTAAVMKEFAAPLESGSAAGAKTAGERSPLSPRERELVALIAQGYKNKDMAEKLFISEQTVKNHLHNIFDKLGVSDRLELALYAIHKGLHYTTDHEKLRVAR